MSLSDELLATARYLARRNNNRPTDADLRRSVSTAYYALFHRLIDAASARLVPNPGQQTALARVFDHGRMRAACEALGKKPVPPATAAALGGGAVPAALGRLAEAFVTLQQQRHAADYDRSWSSTVGDVRNLLGQVEVAFTDLAAVENTPAGQAFLLLLLIGEPKPR
jgi:hypothetical protein